MKNYVISFKHSRDGRSCWFEENRTVKAESEAGAYEQIKSQYPYVKEIRLINVR